MRIGIITIHYGINYGSVLQCYALAKFLSEFGKDVEVINYIPNRYTKKRRYLATEKSISGLKKAVYLLLVAPNTFRYQCIFDSFIKKYIPIGKKIFKYKELENIYSDYDVLITGSDQVWNTDYNEGIDKAYYLTFGSNTSRKISYAASCGKDGFSQEEERICRDYWSKLDAISLREDVTTSWFHNIGFNHAINVLDPVFLLSQEEWKSIASPREINEPYIFIYALDGDTKGPIRIANNIAKGRNLKVVMISYGHFWSREDGCDYYLTARGPQQFLSLISNADFVVTNSFHGIAFSLRFRKQFIPVKRGKYNNRIESILRLVGLEERLNTNDHLSQISTIDYDNSVDKIIESMEQKSKSFLQENIKP